MCSFKIDFRSLASLVSLIPTDRAKAPVVTWLQPWEAAPLRCCQVVSLRFGVVKKLKSNFFNVLVKKQLFEILLRGPQVLP